jgi:histidinol-phosphatase (PHP family)
LSEILGDVIRQGLALEINTSGLRQAVREPYPGVELLGMYARLGGKSVIVGSDAHRVSDLGAGLSEAREMAAQAGLEVISLPRRVREHPTELVPQHSERDIR